jgi:hypothetical protein
MRVGINAKGTNTNRKTYVLDLGAHPRLGDTTSTKDLDSILRGLLSRPRREGLQQGDLASELTSLLLIRLQNHRVNKSSHVRSEDRKRSVPYCTSGR